MKVDAVRDVILNVVRTQNLTRDGVEALSRVARDLASTADGSRLLAREIEEVMAGRDQRTQERIEAEVSRRTKHLEDAATHYLDAYSELESKYIRATFSAVAPQPAAA